MYDLSSLEAHSPPPHAVEQVFASGEFAHVCRIRRDDTGETQVLKRLRDDAPRKDQATARFVREVLNLKAATHPYILRILDQGHDAEGPWFITEYCAYGDLRQWRASQGGNVAIVDALAIADQVLDGLAHLHTVTMPRVAEAETIVARGIVHRDIKPDNIFVTGLDPLRIKVADLSLSKCLALAEAFGITTPRTVGHTFEYVSRSQLIDFRRVPDTADLWSAMATLFFLLTGTPPRDFSGTLTDDWVVQSRAARGIRGLNTSIPASLAALIDGMLQENQAPPHTSAASLRQALRELAVQNGMAG